MLAGVVRQLAAQYTEYFLGGKSTQTTNGYSGNLLVPEGVQTEAEWLHGSNVEKEIKRTGAGWTR